MNSLKVWNTLDRFHMMVADLPSSDTGMRRWLGIYPIRPSSHDGRAFLKREGVVASPSHSYFRVRYLAIDPNILENDYEPGESDFHTITSRLVLDRQGLIEELREYGIEIEDLKMPYESKYPI